MSHIVFDSSLLQGPTEANASIAGIPLRLNPNSVSLSYDIKMNQTQTVGGFVFQIYGVEWSDFVVSGQFGTGGWQEQRTFYEQMNTLAGKTAADQRAQGTAGAVLPSGSFRFLFPLLGYDFMVFLKSYASNEGESVEIYNENINPSYTLTFSIDNDNSSLAKVAVSQYIQRLQNGVGYTPNQYNGPDTKSSIATTIQDYLSAENSLSAKEAALTGASTGASGTSPTDFISTVTADVSEGNVTYSASQIAAFAKSAGFAGQNLIIAVAVALAESGGRNWAIDNDADGSQDQGLWQINTVHASEFSGMTRDPGTGSTATKGTSSMFNPTNNAKAAYAISSNGTNWSPWSTYQSGVYESYMSQAKAAVNG